MAQFGIGQPVARTEDPRFLTGQGNYVDDIRLYGETHGYMLRSPHAHARIVSIDTSAATAAPGVLGVWTGADLDADDIGPIPCEVMPVAFGGPPAEQIAHPILARDGTVRHVGDCVAFVVAETLHQAKDAAEAILVDYEMLPAAIETKSARTAGQPQVWDNVPNNTWFEMERGDKAATDAAFAKAAHVTQLKIYNNRLSANAMEPRCSLAEYRQASDHTTLWISSQGPHRLRPALSQFIFKKPATSFRVICPDVGGGFGMKGGIFPEDAMVCYAAMKLKRPVRWSADRSESLLSDTHSRDAWVEAELALDGDGKILGARMDATHAQGAYLSASAAVNPVLGSMMYPGVYDIPTMHLTIRGVFTHTPWTGPYRGAGRPEAIYVIERLVETAARELGVDSIEMRRRNYIAAEKMPYQTPIMTMYDSGVFGDVTDKAVSLADYDGFEARKAESAARGKLRGRGATYFIEVSAPFNDRMEVRFDEAGTVTIVAGTHSHGQGHQTVFAQMVHDWLGVPFEDIRLVQGDTDTVGYGRGTFGSRSTTIGGSALRNAADRIIEKAKPMAAHMLEAAEADIEFAEGAFTVAGTDRKVGIQDIARMSHIPAGWPADLGIGLEAQGSFTPEGPNWPNGCHICEVEIDPDTGEMEIVRYTAIDDSGVIINPLLFEGQIHGGLAMGIGQAIGENVAFDAESGQVLSGSFMDYHIPRADDFPHFELGDIEEACRTNPLGVKGAGESGTVGAPQAIMHAVIDALSEHGITDLEMPATPERIWRALQEAA